jgi:hypothetical protein
MKLKELILLILLVNTLFCFGQDTIKFEPSVFYSSKEYPNRSKAFAFQAQFAREVIMFSETKKRIEYCYYYDNERVCFGESYEILNDSVIQIKSKFSDSIFENWKHKIADNNSYLVQRKYGSYCETGTVNSLMPFLKTGKFITQHQSSKDTLWITDYTNYNFKGPYRTAPSYYFPKAKIKEKIYQDFEVDKMPTTIKGDSIFNISLARKDYCLSEPMTAVRTITFVVTSSGEIKNIEQFEGNFDLQYCPFYIMELMKQVLSIGRWIPGKVDGKNVNVKCYADIEMQDERLNEFAKHPAFDKKRMPTTKYSACR